MEEQWPGWFAYGETTANSIAALHVASRIFVTDKYQKMARKRAPDTRADHPLRILFATSEAVPYFKSGGLADVARSLPDALVRRGHDIRIMHPWYSTMRRGQMRLDPDVQISVPWAGGPIRIPTLLHQPRGRAAAILLEHPAFTIATSPYEDTDPAATGRRFALFSRAVLHYAVQWNADVIHLNDWQTGLVPAYALVDGISIPTVFSIHNLAYQGVFIPPILDQVGLPRELFRTENGLEFYGQVSYMKSGLALSHRLTTVSPSYAREIQTPEFGAGFDGLLRFRSRDLFGILNGIDLALWNPADDDALAQSYDADSLNVKDALRKSLLEQYGLDAARPLFSVVSRLAHQKGIDVVLAAVPELLDAGANLFVLGDGDRALEAQFEELARRFPQRIKAVIGFDDGLARNLYAGSDFFLMPSRYEPCGLGQMIAQRYGTPPVVRITGGLRDTVRDGETGFCFNSPNVADLSEAVRRAIAVWRGSDWDALRRRSMALDWSWRSSAVQYEDVYAYAIGPRPD